jgi:hypothetical protein
VKFEFKEIIVQRGGKKER